MVVHWHQDNVAATDLRAGALTPRDRDVLAAIIDARGRGLAVLVFPIVWVEERAPGVWRGTLAPKDIDAWWAAYERFILHYAHLAELGGAEWLSVGSELGSTETWQDRWFHLISRVQGETAAALLYSANWDHYKSVSFWPRLDAVGINGYLPLAKKDDATVSEMTTTWRAAAGTLVAAAEALEKPLVLTEVGYLSANGGAVRPWDYGSEGALDLEEQRRAYAAFASVWRSESALTGVLFWDWNSGRGKDDRGYSPRGKPAEKVARRFFRARLE